MDYSLSDCQNKLQNILYAKDILQDMYAHKIIDYDVMRDGMASLIAVETLLVRLFIEPKQEALNYRLDASKKE